MGTASIIRVFDYEHNELCQIYSKWDGYYDGMGKKLEFFLSSGKLVNGMTLGNREKCFNGPECFAAALVVFLKGNEAGGVYLTPPGTRQWEGEYEYHIAPSPGSSIESPGTLQLFAVEEGKTIPWSAIVLRESIEEVEAAPIKNKVVQVQE